MGSYRAEVGGQPGPDAHWVTEGLGFSAPPNEDFIKRVIGVAGDTVAAADDTTTPQSSKSLGEHFSRAASIAPTAAPSSSDRWSGGQRRCSRSRCSSPTAPRACR